MRTFARVVVDQDWSDVVQEATPATFPVAPLGDLLRRSKSGISFWEIGESDDLGRLAAAMVANGQGQFKSIDFRFLAEDDVSSLKLIIRKSKGNTWDSYFRERHFDLAVSNAEAAIHLAMAMSKRDPITFSADEVTEHFARSLRRGYFGNPEMTEGMIKQLWKKGLLEVRQLDNGDLPGPIQE